MEIQPLRKRSSLGADIARQLHDLIQSGALKPGERLPGQRDLAVRFGASMASVREAISALAAAGLLDARPGRGTVVRDMAEAEPQFDGWLGMAGDDTQMADLLEARRVLESFTVATAAQRATPGQRARLHELLRDMAQAIVDPVAYVEADLAFHLGIADVAGNRVIGRIMKAIQAPMKRQLHESNIRHMLQRGDMGVSYQTHVRLVAAIDEGNSEVAVGCLAEMVDRAGRMVDGGMTRAL